MSRVPRRRIVNELGSSERNALWITTNTVGRSVFYQWLPRDPQRNDGDDSPAWHYSEDQTRNGWDLSLAEDGTVTAAVLAPSGEWGTVTFYECLRLTPHGGIYFDNHGHMWTLSGAPPEHAEEVLRTHTPVKICGNCGEPWPCAEVRKARRIIGATPKLGSVR